MTFVASFAFRLPSTGILSTACPVAALLAVGVAPGALAQESPPEASVTHHPSAPADDMPRTMLEAMSPGWNLGNTMEAINAAAAPSPTSQEGFWGNPHVTQAQLDAVAAAGFKSVRIPLAWDQYAEADGTISRAWMDRVGEVVGYARKAGLYVVINIHWDGGWMQPTYADRDEVNAKIASYWTQIATAFRDADDHVLFAGTNEVMVADVYTEPTAENCEVQNGFNQLFVDTVRATGGANADRWLVVQSYNTNIDWALSCNADMPSDPTPGRMMMEVHYYDPYNFTLNTDSKIWQWGSLATKGNATETWADEAHADRQFGKMKTTFVDRGIPVILGEYAASLRSEKDKSQTFRNYWNLYITYSAVRHGLIPMYWDNGYTSNHNSGLFNRARAQLAYPQTAAVIVEGTKEGLAKPVAE